jgi:hypothetical protein
MSRASINSVKNTLEGFIGRCKRLKVVPDEKHIDVYLEQCNSLEMRNIFIKYCFYYWDQNNIEAALMDLMFEA